MTRLFCILSIMLPCFARLCYTDIKVKQLEHFFIFLLLLVFFFTDVSLSQRLMGTVVPFALCRFFGFGDVLLLAVLGFDFGFYSIIEIFSLASICSGIVCSAALFTKKLKKEDELPFAPYICSACILVLLRGYLFPGY